MYQAFDEHDIWLAHYLLDNESDSLTHVGVGKLDGAPGRGSGRFELGSGENPHQHGSYDLLDRMEMLRKDGYSEIQIATMLKINGPTGEPSTDQLRKLKKVLKEERQLSQLSQINKMVEAGKGWTEIGRELGISESKVRDWYKKQEKIKTNSLRVTADYLKGVVDEHKMLEVGEGAELFMQDVSYEKFKKAVKLLQEEGYELYNLDVEQVTNPGNYTKQKILCKPGTPYQDIHKLDEIYSLADESTTVKDGGTYVGKKFEYPTSIDSKRIAVNYTHADGTGGAELDGLIEIRPGVKDLSLGDSNYSQVRILVDGTHYIKGMAIYSDRVPEGSDILINTNRKDGTPLMRSKEEIERIFEETGREPKQVLKNIKDDPDNPFGANIKENGGQYFYDDPNGKFIDPLTGKKQSLGAINKKSDENDWEEWKDTLPTQMLTKQPIELAKQQTNLALQDKKDELRSIMELDNPVVKKKLLIDFADSCDSAAVELKAAALPRQKFQVLLPVPSLKDNECYAPNFRNGEQVALIRYPHQSINEIPILTVNNNNPEGNKYITKQAKDAIGINKRVADRMSGADFDGDTVMVIPCNNGKVKIATKPVLKELEGFDPKEAYPERKGMKLMTNTGLEMGKITNLITDMTLQAAPDHQLVRAIKHALTVIDAEKHHLDYQRSEKENNIDELKQTYQQHIDDDGYGGAGTLISKAKSPVRVPRTTGQYSIDPNTGEKIWKIADDKDRFYEKKRPVKVRDPENPRKYLRDENGNFVFEKDENGKIKYVNTGKIGERTKETTLMAATKDARDLISTTQHPMEQLYANYANSLKALGNQARLESLRSTAPRWGTEEDKAAAKKYANEVNELNVMLNDVGKNRVRERAAQRKANAALKVKKDVYKEQGLSKKEIKEKLTKDRQRAIVAARSDAKTHREDIYITDKQWEAIQARAISPTKLERILTRANPDRVRELATPKSDQGLAQWKINKIKAMTGDDYTMEQIASSVGVSTSTVRKYM